MKTEDVRKLQETVKKIAEKLWQNESGVLKEVDRILPQLTMFLQEFLIVGEQMNAQGEDFPLEVLVQQVKNLDEAYREKDIIMLADTMEYEINNSMEVYIEILESMETGINV